MLENEVLIIVAHMFFYDGYAESTGIPHIHGANSVSKNRVFQIFTVLNCFSRIPVICSLFCMLEVAWATFPLL